VYTWQIIGADTFDYLPLALEVTLAVRNFLLLKVHAARTASCNGSSEMVYPTVVGKARRQDQKSIREFAVALPIASDKLRLASRYSEEAH
jgi:hypothetical protein